MVVIYGGGGAHIRYQTLNAIEHFARWPFNFTLFIAGVFGLAAGGSPNFVTLASLFAVIGFGVGGNMPVDSAVFLDFVPGSHQYLLTILSIWWAIGQLVASLVRHYMGVISHRRN